MTAPSPRQINKAIPCLRQAYELSVKIEALDGYASDDLVAQHIRELMRQLRYAASHLGMDMNDVPRLAVNNDQPIIPYPAGR